MDLRRRECRWIFKTESPYFFLNFRVILSCFDVEENFDFDEGRYKSGVEKSFLNLMTFVVGEFEDEFGTEV